MLVDRHTKHGVDLGNDLDLVSLGYDLESVPRLLKNNASETDERWTFVSCDRKYRAVKIALTERYFGLGIAKLDCAAYVFEPEFV